MSSWRSGEETAELVGRLCAVERRLHSTLGVASLAVPSAGVTVVLDELSLQHAWHAELLSERLPHRDGVDREALVDLGPADELFDVVDRYSRSGDQVGVLTLYAVYLLPRLLTTVSELAEGCSPAAERSLQRACGLIELDSSNALGVVDELRKQRAWATSARAHAERALAEADRASVAGGLDAQKLI